MAIYVVRYLGSLFYSTCTAFYYHCAIGLFLSIMFRPSSPVDVNIALHLIPFLQVGVAIGLALGVFTLNRIQAAQMAYLEF